MRLLFVNPVHPSTPHISAVRAWRFAEALAQRGHHVVLLCAAPAGAQASAPEAIAQHDWRSPFVLACAAGQAGWLDKSRLPPPLRKGLTAWRLLRGGGELGGWAENATHALGRLAGTFSPDLVWTTFGKMEAVVAARRIARQARCPWVLDIKDNWELYVPRGLGRLMAWRTGGWAALTANSCFTQEKARLWQRGDATVVYSGVDEAFFTAAGLGQPDRGQFDINLIGGLYFRDRLEALLAGIGQWAAGLAPAQRGQARLRYFGGDVRLFAEASVRADIGIAVEALGYRPVAELAQYCRNAAVNAYIAHPGTFHHKLLELLACNRPVLAFPGETEESRALARRVEGDLRTPASADAVAAELSRLHRRWQPGGAPPAAVPAIHAYAWASQAGILEQVIQHAAGQHHA